MSAKPRSYPAPTKPGWYWVRKFEHTNTASIVEVQASFGGLLIVRSQSRDGIRDLRVADFGASCWGPEVKEPRF
jgi:hypothetical protein